MFARAQLRPYVLLVLIKPLDCARGDNDFSNGTLQLISLPKKINLLVLKIVQTNVLLSLQWYQ